MSNSSNFFNIMNKVMPASPVRNHTPLDDCKPPKKLSMQLGLFSTSTYYRLPSSISFDSIKSQTARVSSGVFSTIKDHSQKVSQLIKYNKQNRENKKESDMRFPSIFEQLKWPNLSLDNRLKKHSTSSRDQEEEEENIVDRFVGVIQSEDNEENPESTFFNHPTRRRNDREEIRRRLAMGGEEEPDQPTDQRRLSLQTRLQTGMNLQICFMNETASDCESQCSDTESTQDHHIDNHPKKSCKGPCTDFASRQTQLQAEARLALSQAKDMARMQMEVDRQAKRCSPVTEIIQQSFNKIGLTFPDNKRRLSRQLLTDMNVAQLQVIVNHLHTQIEGLNEDLVQHLLSRDDLHMEQDSRLVDIEDLTNHLAAKNRNSNSNSSSSSNNNNNNNNNNSKSSPSSNISTPSSTRSPPSTASMITPPSSASLVTTPPSSTCSLNTPPPTTGSDVRAMTSAAFPSSK